VRNTPEDDNRWRPNKLDFLGEVLAYTGVNDIVGGVLVAILGNDGALDGMDQEETPCEQVRPGAPQRIQDKSAEVVFGIVRCTIRSGSRVNIRRMRRSHTHEHELD